MRSRCLLFLLLGISSLSARASNAGKPAQASSYAYEVTSSAQFGVIELNTGVFSPIANMGVTLGGLGAYQGALYGNGLGTGYLYVVNPTNGSVTAIGNSGVSYLGLGSTTQGLYAFDRSMNLYSVNAVTGIATEIGPTGLSAPSGFGVSSGSETLYISVSPDQGCGNGTYLYSVNTTTAAATEIGETSVPCGIGAMVFVNGTLYAGGNISPIAVYTLNTTNGTSTFVADVSGTDSYFYGLAPTSLITSVSSKVDISAVNESSTSCELGGTICFSIQQNFYISIPMDTADGWFQNVVQLENVEGTWYFRQAYCTLPPFKKLNCHNTTKGQGWSVVGNSLPLISLESVLDDGTLYFGTTVGENKKVFTVQIPAGASIVAGPFYPSIVQPSEEPELIFVGEENGATANFFPTTSGYVIGGLGVSGAQQTVTAVPMTGLCTSNSEETSVGLSWLTNMNHPSKVGFSAVKNQTGQEGIKIIPGSMISCPPE